jgi:hypothetical protein
MASKLKRRIPVIFSGVGASAGSASVASVGVANIPPSWTDALGDSFSITAGVPFSYTFTAYDPNPGDLIDFIQNSVSAGLTVTENDQSGLYRTITISSSTGLAAGTYTAALDLDETLAVPFTDWQSRSQGDGVVWAHNFEHENEVLNFLISPAIGNDPARTWETTHHALDVSYEVGTGFAGGGCLSIQVPAADVAFERSYGQTDASVQGTPWYNALASAFGTANPGVPFGRGVWRRPYAPLTTTGSDRTTGSGTGQTDRAANGTLTTRAWTPWTTSTMTAGFRHGVYSHADYAMPSGWTRDGGEFYLQYRMKVPLKRFYSDRTLPVYTGAAGSRFFTNTATRRARQSAQKYLWLSNLTTGVEAQELVVSGYPQLRISDGAPYDTGQTAFLILYTAFGPEIFRSQEGSWEVPADVWITYLHRVRFGHNATADTTVEWYASVNGSAYVTLGSSSTKTLNYTAGTPFGGNCFEPTNYNNSTDNLSIYGVTNCRNPAYAVNAGTPALAQETYVNRFTQIIFSTAYIPPPAAGA